MKRKSGSTGKNLNKALAIKIDAGNDKNGNPRRGWIIVSCADGNTLDFVDEGYSGRGALDMTWPNYVEGPTIVTTPGEYRDFLRKGF
jgi:hypothetical protein